MEADAPPYSGTLRLDRDVDFGADGLTSAVFKRAPSGHFGVVVLGRCRRSEKRVAVKLLPSVRDVAAETADIAFKTESVNLREVRSAVGMAQALQRHGAPLTEVCSRTDKTRRCSEPHCLHGHKHVVLVYGVGTEPVLSGLDRPGPAHFIVMEALTGGTLESAIPTLADITARIKISAELASALAFLASAHVIHADIKVRREACVGRLGCPQAMPVPPQQSNLQLGLP